MQIEKRIAMLDNEKKQLKRINENMWKKLEEVVLPLWKVDGSLESVYEQLAELQMELDQLAISQKNMTAFERSRLLRDIQDRLHEFENKYWRNEKAVPKGAMKIPGGQAVISNLLNKCYRKVHLLLENEPDGNFYFFSFAP
jgi:dsDNA-specific endonuclease/ATPase MutS2